MQDAISQALAWGAQASTGAAQQQGFPPEWLFFIGAIGLLWYFMLARPGRNDQRERDKALEALSKGDKVVTAGGLHGTIEGVDKADKTVTVAVAPKVVLTLNVSAIASVTSKKDKSKADKSAAGEDAKEAKKD